jgi:hypothetical protein
LIERYRDSTAWGDLSQATKRNRENHFKQVCKTGGSRPYRAIRQVDIVAGATIAPRRNTGPEFSGCNAAFQMGKAAGHRPDDPTNITNPKRKKAQASSLGRGRR